jgi:parallel beta-helix repeat protein
VNFLNSNNMLLEKSTIMAMDGACFSASGWTADGAAIMNDITVRNNDISYCGHMGLSGWGNRYTITNNNISYNNTRGFENNWAAGGMKFAGAGGLQNSIVSNNKIHRNFAPGFWCDYCTKGGNSFTGNEVFYNGQYGIHIEVSTGFFVKDNYFYGNARPPIYHRESADSTYDSNYMLYSMDWGIFMFHSDPATFGRILHALGKPAVGNVVTNNKFLLGNMNGSRGGNMMYMDFYMQNRSNHNTYVHNNTVPWLFRGIMNVYNAENPKASYYQAAPSATDTFAAWKTRTQNDLNSTVHLGTPDIVLPGETKSLKQKILDKEYISKEKIKEYSAALAQ